jgi:hypothetical protein
MSPSAVDRPQGYYRDRDVVSPAALPRDIDELATSVCGRLRGDKPAYLFVLNLVVHPVRAEQEAVIRE